MWAGAISLGIIALAGWLVPKKEPVAEWTLVVAISLFFVLWLWHMTRGRHSLRLHEKFKLQEKLRDIASANEAVCPLCGGTLMVDDRLRCSRCGVERMVLSV